MLLLVLNEGPHLKPRLRYGKGRYKNTPINMKPDNKSKHKGRPKTPPTRLKRRRSVKQDDWGSMHQQMPLLDPDFSNYFTFNCKQYAHYLDTVLHMIDPFPDSQRIQSGFTELDGNLFLPTGLYVEDGAVPIISGSGCSIAVSPCKADFGDC